MFTVNHVKHDGSEEIFKAISVQYLPFTEANGDCSGVHLNCGPGEHEAGVRTGLIREGNVFVMNDSGSTVGKFYMPPRNLPPPAA